MRKRHLFSRLRPAFALAAAGLLLILAAGPARAHEHRRVGNVDMVVGWGSEPTYAGYLNAAEIALNVPGPSEDEEGPPISDAVLEVEVLFGDESSTTSTGPLPMEEAFSEPGVFGADLIPTRPGTYTFHFTGTVAGQEVDEVFTSGEDTFSDVDVPADIQFPEKDPTAGELADSVQRLSTRSEDAGGNSTALWIAIGSGVVALIALGIALRKRPS
jgi:hypothetical protein